MHTFAQSLRSSVRQLATVAAACGLAVLTACGGGGGGSDGATPSGSNGSADVYVGTWLSNCVREGSNSGRYQSTVTKQSANTAKSVEAIQVYASSDCSGAVLQTVSQGSSVFTLMGTKTASGKLVDKVTMSDDGDTPYKFLVYTDGKTLMLAQDDSPTDADGYPTALDSTVIFTKQ